MTLHESNPRLHDMLHHARKAHEKASMLSFDQFVLDEEASIVVTWHLLIIGEAASRIPAHDQQRLPNIPWRRVTGMRHRIVHDYGNIDMESSGTPPHNTSPP